MAPMPNHVAAKTRYVEIANRIVPAFGTEMNFLGYMVLRKRNVKLLSKKSKLAPA